MSNLDKTLLLQDISWVDSEIVHSQTVIAYHSKRGSPYMKEWIGYFETHAQFMENKKADLIKKLVSMEE